MLDLLKMMDFSVKIIILILVTLFLPFILIAVEKNLLPYPAFVEEIVKALVIYFFIFNFSSLKQKILAALLFGLLFGLSENIFYLVNIIDSENLALLWQRFLYTMPMHVITVLVMLFAGLKKEWIFCLGLLAAIIIHLLFNTFAANF
jgi:RsiW-degrading membrane proteinase PrsW (M82 family)